MTRLVISCCCLSRAEGSGTTDMGLDDETLLAPPPEEESTAAVAEEKEETGETNTEEDEEGAEVKCVELSE